MSYIDEIDLFTRESELERNWNSNAVFIYEDNIIVEIDLHNIPKGKASYVPFVFNNKEVILNY